jgi:hypothetical protein
MLMRIGHALAAGAALLALGCTSAPVSLKAMGSFHVGVRKAGAAAPMW